MNAGHKPLDDSVTAGPGNFQAAAHEMGLTFVSWLGRAVVCDDDISRHLPKDMVGQDGKTLIIFRHSGDGHYDIDGWEPWHDGMFGGRYARLENALGWIQRARDVRAGLASDFRGV